MYSSSQNLPVGHIVNGQYTVPPTVVPQYIYGTAMRQPTSQHRLEGRRKPDRQAPMHTQPMAMKASFVYGKHLPPPRSQTYSSGGLNQHVNMDWMLPSHGSAPTNQLAVFVPQNEAPTNKFDNYLPPHHATEQFTNYFPPYGSMENDLNSSIFHQHFEHIQLHGHSSGYTQPPHEVSSGWNQLPQGTESSSAPTNQLAVFVPQNEAPTNKLAVFVPQKEAPTNKLAVFVPKNEAPTNAFSNYFPPNSGTEQLTNYFPPHSSMNGLDASFLNQHFEQNKATLQNIAAFNSTVCSMYPEIAAQNDATIALLQKNIEGMQLEFQIPRFEENSGQNWNSLYGIGQTNGSMAQRGPHPEINQDVSRQQISQPKFSQPRLSKPVAQAQVSQPKQKRFQAESQRASQTEFSKPEGSKRGGPKPEVSKPEVSKPEVPKPKVPKQDVPKQEVPKRDPSTEKRASEIVDLSPEMDPLLSSRSAPQYAVEYSLQIKSETGVRHVDVLRVNRDPDLLVLPEFITDDECEQLLALGNGRYERSKTSRGYAGGPVSSYSGGVSQNRTSAQVRFGISEAPIVRRLENRVAAACELPSSHIESLVLLKYEVGEFFNEHHDGDFRAKSMLIYLNDVEEGGHTEFPNLGLSVAPRKGAAIMWANTLPDGTADERLVHAGLPVLKGTKYAINCFVGKDPRPIVTVVN